MPTKKSVKKITRPGHGNSDIQGLKKPGKSTTPRAHALGNQRKGPSRHKKIDTTAHNSPPFLPKGQFWLYGQHAVESALKNKIRRKHCLIAGPKANPELVTLAQQMSLPIQKSDSDMLKNYINSDVPHQDILLAVSSLPSLHIEDLLKAHATSALYLILDQVTDPHNVGACLRSAAALGATAVITQDKHSPSESGVLAKSASGALETLPWLRATNLAKTIELMKDYGIWSVGLAGDGDQTIAESVDSAKIAIVMGSEGKGLRPLVRQHCDFIARIPMTDAVESLNISNAAAIALYEAARNRLT